MIKNKNFNIVRLLTILFLLIIFPYSQCKSEKETTHADDQTEVSKSENKEVHALGDTCNCKKNYRNTYIKQLPNFYENQDFNICYLGDLNQIGVTYNFPYEFYIRCCPLNKIVLETDSGKKYQVESKHDTLIVSVVKHIPNYISQGVMLKTTPIINYKYTLNNESIGIDTVLVFERTTFTDIKIKKIINEYNRSIQNYFNNPVDALSVNFFSSQYYLFFAATQGSADAMNEFISYKIKYQEKIDLLLYGSAKKADNLRKESIDTYQEMLDVIYIIKNYRKKSYN